LFGTWYTTYHNLSIATRQGVVDGPEFRSVYLGKVKEIMKKAGTSPLYWCCSNNQNKGYRR
jgi:hypothetical protein